MSKKTAGAAAAPEMSPADIQQAQQRLTEFVRGNRQKKLHLEKMDAEYDQLAETLTSLPEKLSHPVMVPMCGVGFMRGHIEHTNEITVLLGDNWFLECSAKHAVEIIGRRKAFLHRSIEELESEFGLVKGKLGLTNELVQQKDGFVEIIERIDDDEENSVLQGGLRLPGSSTALPLAPANTAAAPKIQVIGSSGATVPEFPSDEEDDDDDDLMNFDEDEEELEEEDDDVDDEEIEASLQLAIQMAKLQRPAGGTPIPAVQPAAAKGASLPQISSSKPTTAPTATTAAPSIVKSTATVTPAVSAGLPKVSVFAAKKRAAVAPAAATSASASSAASSSLGGVTVVERDVVEAPVVRNLAHVEAPAPMEEEPKRVSRFKAMRGK